MKQRWIILFAALIASGCDDRQESEALIDTESVPRFSAKDGVYLPETTRRSIGLKLVEPVERTFADRIAFDVRIFESSGARGRAAGLASAREAARLEAGQTVEFGLTRSLSGTISAIRGEAKSGIGLAEVLVDVKSKGADLNVGTFLQAAVTLTNETVAMAIPKSAVLSCGEGDFVYSVSGGYFARAPVTLGRRDAEFVEVIDGLFEGDTVVAEPVMSLWMVELATVKSGQACCVKPSKD